MREKKLQCIFSFKNTVDALEMEKIGEKRKLSGRLIPLPSIISAGCGLAWTTEPENKEQTLSVLKEEGLEPSSVHDIVF
mgnify:FL=1